MTFRHVAALAVTALLGGAILVASWANKADVTITVTGLVGVLILQAVLVSHWRTSRHLRIIAGHTSRLAKELDATQRRLLAAVENERLSAADRHNAVVASIDALLAEAHQAQRRTMAAIETERLAAADRHRDVQEGLAALEGEPVRPSM